MSQASLAVFHRRAMLLSDGMKLCQDDLATYAAAAALLAVHSAISYSDAVLVGLGNSRPRGENHRDAIVALRRACNSAHIDPKGISHLQRLITAKTDISYGENWIDHEKVKSLCAAAERFQVWAERILLQRRGGRRP